MPVYHHEIIHTVPGQEEEYMTSLQALGDGGYWLAPTAPAAAAASPRIGPFRTAEVSGAWPKTINLFDAHTWDRIVDGNAVQFAGDARDIEEWWQRNTKLRTRGEDRILIPAPGAPLVADIAGRQPQGGVILQLIERVPWGEAGAYLARMLEMLRPAARRFGWELFGAYGVAFHPREVLSVWAAETWREFARLLGASDDGDLHAWNAYRASVVTKCDEMVLFPGRTNRNVSPPAR
jgi:hypothetical protein